MSIKASFISGPRCFPPFSSFLQFLIHSRFYFTIRSFPHSSCPPFSLLLYLPALRFHPSVCIWFFLSYPPSFISSGLQMCHSFYPTSRSIVCHHSFHPSLPQSFTPVFPHPFLLSLLLSFISSSVPPHIVSVRPSILYRSFHLIFFLSFHPSFGICFALCSKSYTLYTSPHSVHPLSFVCPSFLISSLLHFIVPAMSSFLLSESNELGSRWWFSHSSTPRLRLFPTRHHMNDDVFLHVEKHGLFKLFDQVKHLWIGCYHRSKRVNIKLAAAVVSESWL